MTPEDFAATVREIQLTRVAKFESRCVFKDEAIARAIDSNTLIDTCFQNQMIIIKTYLWGAENKRYVFTKPSTWWDAFKQEKFPSWLKKHFPVKLDVTTVKAIEVIPSLQLPGHHPEIVFHIKDDVKYDPSVDYPS